MGTWRSSVLGGGPWWVNFSGVVCLIVLRVCVLQNASAGRWGSEWGSAPRSPGPNFWSFFCDFLKGNTPPKKISALRGCEAAPRRLRRRGAAPLVIAPKNRDFDFWRSRVAPNDSARWAASFGGSLVPVRSISENLWSIEVD